MEDEKYKDDGSFDEYIHSGPSLYDSIILKQEKEIKVLKAHMASLKFIIKTLHAGAKEQKEIANSILKELNKNDDIRKSRKAV